jgi:hypothetical protein
MKHVSKILAFLLVNAAGFMSVPLCFILVTKLGLLTMPREDLELEAFKTQFMHGTYMTWLTCAIFSIAYFFIKGKERLFFPVGTDHRSRILRVIRSLHALLELRLHFLVRIDVQILNVFLALIHDFQRLRGFLLDHFALCDFFLLRYRLIAPTISSCSGL